MIDADAEEQEEGRGKKKKSRRNKKKKEQTSSESPLRQKKLSFKEKQELRKKAAEGKEAGKATVLLMWSIGSHS